MALINLEEHIFNINKPKEKIFIKEDVSRKTIAYTYDGLGQERQIEPNNINAFARVDVINGRARYYVKVGKVGRRNGQLPDPKSLEFNKGETGMRIGGNNVYDWIYVRREIFDSYMKFLKTGEKKWLAEARNLLKV